MRLTETQKNFRKQMREIQQDYSPYDNQRSGNPFHRKPPSTIFVFLLIVMIISIYRLVNLEQPTNRETTRNFDNGIQISSISNDIDSFTTDRVLTYGEHMFIEKLSSVVNEISKCWGIVSEFHKISWGQRNLTEYKEALLTGITTSDRLLLELDQMKVLGQFENVYLSTKEIIANSRLAFKYYLDYLSSQNSSDIELGNKYLSMVNQNIDKKKANLIKVLESGGYKYEIKTDGSVKYWYKK